MGIDRPGALDVAAIIFSPLIVAGLTVIFLAGFWVEAVWGCFKGENYE